MKYIALTFLVFSTTTYAKLGKVPMDWLTPDSATNQKSFQMLSPEAQELNEAYANILDSKAELFDDIPNDDHKRWHLQSIKTELAVEPEGTLGVMGVGGEAALELIWIKKESTPKGNQLFTSPLEEVVEPEAQSVQINGEMNQETIINEITPVIDLAMATGHIKRRRRLFNNLVARALEFQKTVRELESTPVMGPWYAYKYQLELYISAEGKITLFEVGGSMRLRMEWWRLQKKEAPVVNPPMILPELSPNAKFLASLASDLEVMDEVKFDNNFRLNVLKVGLGTTVEGNFYFVKGKAKAVGSIFFKRDEVTQENLRLHTFAETVSSYSLHDDKTQNQISRYNFRNGIKKSANIARFFASHAKTKSKGQFELNVIETEFELFGSGGIGLVTVEGSAVLTLFVTRNVTI